MMLCKVSGSYTSNKGGFPLKRAAKAAFCIVVLSVFGQIALAAQETVSLETALRQTADYLNSMLPPGSTLAVTNMESGAPLLAQYFIDTLNSHFTNDHIFIPVDRQDVSDLEKELQFNISGAVDVNAALSIGKMLGAQIIIKGRFIKLSGNYQLTVQAREVETSKILAQKIVLVHAEPTLVALLRGQSKGSKITVSPFWFLWNGDDSWKYKRFYPGFRAGYALHTYQLNTADDAVKAEAFSTFEIAALLELQLTDLFALQTELSFSTDTVSADLSNGNVRLSSTTLTVPLFVKVTHRPGIFYLAAFGGPDVVFPLGQLEVEQAGQSQSYRFSPAIGLTGGVNAGIRMGPGVLFLDLRYSGDFIFVRANDADQYRRNGFSVSLGYTIGLIDRRESK